MFTMSVMFKGHLMNYSSSFQEMGGKDCPTVSSLKLILAYCQEGRFFLKWFFKGEFAMLLYLKETGRMGFALPGALSLVGWLQELKLLSNKHLSPLGQQAVFRQCLLERRAFLSPPSNCCLSLLPLHTHPCQEMHTTLPLPPPPNTHKHTRTDREHLLQCPLYCLIVSCGDVPIPGSVLSS